MAAPASSPDTEHPDRERLRLIGRKVRARLGADKAVQRIPVDKAEIWALARFFDAAECDRLISIIDAVARPSIAYAAAGDVGARTSYSGDLDPDHPFTRTLEQRIDRLLGLPRQTGEVMEGQRYAAGQEFKTHIDWFPPGSPGWEREKDRGGQRAITAMVYLNAVEDGGETDFPRLDIAITPRRGTLVVWNNADETGLPNPWTAHAGNPVRSGTKYVVTKWYRCRRTR